MKAWRGRAIAIGATVLIAASMSEGRAQSPTVDQGEAAFLSGRHAQARSIWTRCALKIDDPVENALARLGLARVALAEGRPDDTLAIVNALDGAALNDSRLVGAIGAVTAEAHALIGDFPEAVGRADAVLSDRSAGAAQRASAAAVKARLAIRLGDQARAKDALDRMAEAIDEPSVAPIHAAAWAELAFDLKDAFGRDYDPGTLYAALHGALSRAENGGARRDAAHVRLAVARLYRRAGRDQEAAILLEDLVATLSPAPDPYVSLDAFSALAEIERRRGRLAAAEAHYENAAGAVDAVRADLLAFGGLGASFEERAAPIYRGLTELHLTRADRAESRADRTRSILAAREALERLRSVELQNYFARPCVDRFEGGSAANAHDAAKDVVSVYFLITPDTLHILGDKDGRAFALRTQVSESRLATLASNLRRRAQRPRDGRYRSAAEELYDILIRPLDEVDVVEADDALLIVPDGPLRTLPFAALHDGDRFLVEARALAVTPVRARPTGGVSAFTDVQAVIAAYTIGDETFPPLPAARRETEGLADKAEGRILIDERFRIAAFGDALEDSDASIVHVASHGVFGGSYGESFLLASDGRITLDRFEAQLRARRASEDPLDLLTLSACQTAVGDERAALGLAGVALKAGARTALASLWSVSDDATARLMLRFYDALSAGDISKAEALRRAQIDLLNDAATAHPAFWSAFLMIGEGL